MPATLSNQQNISASKQTIKSRASALKAIKVGYEVGSRSVLELLNAQVAMADAELAYRFAQYDFVLTQLRLKFWSGEIAEQDLKHLDLLLEY